MLDWNEMRVFVRVVEAGGFSRAAEALQMPTSTVSRKLADLEARLGVRLLRRTTRKVAPTELGLAHYHRVAPLVREAEDAEAALREQQRGPSGPVRMSVPGGGQEIFAAAIAEYVARYPEVRLVVEASDRRVDLVGEGFDLAIRGGDVHDDTLIARSLGSNPFALVASPAYLAARGKPRDLEDLATRHDALFLGDGHRRATWMLDDRRIALAPRFISTSLALLREMAASGLGVALAPEFFCRELIDQERLRIVLPQVKTPQSTSWLVYPSRRYQPAAVRVLIEHLLSRLPALRA